MTVNGVVFDTGPLIGIEKRSSSMLAIIDGLNQGGVVVHVPATVLAQAWRGGRQQARLAKFLKSDRVQVEVLDKSLALACGVLCAQSGSKDIVDASVVAIALKLKLPILTGDEEDLAKLRALHAGMSIHTI